MQRRVGQGHSQRVNGAGCFSRMASCFVHADEMHLMVWKNWVDATEVFALHGVRARALVRALSCDEGDLTCRTGMGWCCLPPAVSFSMTVLLHRSTNVGEQVHAKAAPDPCASEGREPDQDANALPKVVDDVG